MTLDRYLDGNAFASALVELFGREMTDSMSCCGECEAINPLGALVVYDQAPGHVVRCPGCGSVQLVAVDRPGGLRFHFAGLRWVESLRSAASRVP
jgi:coenzyme F420-reducing hydrogenase beta subunit